jgi:hypothetical protein
MLVPLETLPGWPPAPPVSVVGMLLLLVGAPLLVIAIAVGISVIRPAQSSYDLMQERQALWVGSGAPEALTEGPSGRSAVTAGESEAGPTDTGGASARW